MTAHDEAVALAYQLHRPHSIYVDSWYRGLRTQAVRLWWELLP